MKVSVVIPVYNNTDSIVDSIDSVLNQSFGNIEIIVVDDCSLDDTYSFLDNKYADSIVLIRSDENRGPGGARNIGLRKAKGDYILFLDSDDVILYNCIEVMVTSAIKSCSDLLLCDYGKFSESFDFKYDTFKSDSTVDIVRISSFDYLRIHGYAPWGVLIRRDILKGDIFPENMIAEDIYSTPTLLNIANSIYYIKSELFKYRVNRDGSVTSNVDRHNQAIINALNLLNSSGNVSDSILLYVNLLIIRYLYLQGVEVDTIKYLDKTAKIKYNSQGGNIILRLELFLVYKYITKRKYIYLNLMKKVRGFFSYISLRLKKLNDK